MEGRTTVWCLSSLSAKDILFSFEESTLNMSKIRISAAMATYNGAKYLGAQLASLAAQEHLLTELIVCDDGSSDTTVALLRTFAETAPFPVHIYENERNLGYSENFLKAAKLCMGDWVAFCDQDDVWLPNKLSDAADAIERHRDASLILQNSSLCNEDLTKLGRLFPASIKVGRHGEGSQYGFWVWPGFLKTIKGSLLHELDNSQRPPNYFPGHGVQSHDKWTCMVANAIGGIVVLDRPAALYRRHDAALTGQYLEQTASERIAKAMFVGADHYAFLSTVAKSTAQYLAQMADACNRKEWSIKLREAARGFLRIAQIQKNRASLYCAPSFIGRVKNFLSILIHGGYVGPALIAMGWKSAAKDLGFALGFVRLSGGSIR
jgi:glycosyltransferase involved in cell wall biosynthesis